MLVAFRPRSGTHGVPAILSIPLLLLGLVVTQPLPACAQQTQVRAQDDNPKILDVRLVEPGRPDTFSRSFHAYWNDSEAPARVTATVREWKEPNGSPIQGQPSVVAAPVPGQVGAWKVDIALRDVTSPGVYTGQVVLAPEGGTGKPSPRTYDVSFVATFKPGMSILPVGALALKVSNCWTSSKLCLLTHLFAPETANTDYSFQVRNASPAPLAVKVTYVTLGVVPDKPALVLKSKSSDTSGAQEIDLPDIPPNGSATFVAVVTNASDLSPGSYPGTLQFSALPAAVKGNSQLLVGDKAGDGSFVVKNIATAEVATAVAVRTSVLLPLVVVLLGVVAGRIAATLATSGFEAKLEFYPRFFELDRTLKKLPDPFKRVIGELLDQAWQTVLKGTTQGADQTFTNLERHATYVAQLLRLREELAKMPSGEPHNQAAAVITEALDQLSGRAPDLDKVRTSRDEALQFMQNLQSSGGGHEAAAVVQSLVVDSQQWRRMEQPAPSQFGMRLATGLGMLAGTGTKGVSLYYTTLRPLMHLIVLFVLVIYGVWQNYATGTDAATFGSQGISQYAVLFLWGVSSDIINKTLQSISFKK